METSAKHWTYDVIKQMAVEQSYSQGDIKDLKTYFAKEIGSVRKHERISSIYDLLDCLERQDELSEYNIEPLRTLADNSGSNNFKEAVASYCAPKEPIIPINEYQEMRLANELRQNLNINITQRVQQTLPVGSQSSLSDLHAKSHLGTDFVLDERKRAAIYKKISEDLGSDWRSFGRELKIIESEMDDIEEKFPRDIKSRVLRLLQIFDKDDATNPKILYLTLSSALNNCGRKDIRRKIERILSY